ncbi:MAG: phage baseplate protein [Candidatus Polarisedimenticolia bacterium]
MRALKAEELLDAWELGLAEPPARRTLALLAAACSEPSIESLALLSIGERDARLLALRELAFGRTLHNVAACARCAERLEWTVTTADLRIADWTSPSDPLSVEQNGYRVRFRLPNSQDLTAASACLDVVDARRRLLAACLLSAHHGDRPALEGSLPDDVVDTIARRMSDADPQGDVAIELTCPACGHEWPVPFDIEAFVWDEITAWAQRALQDVHTLASVYGWRESDILALPAWRRQFYLGLIGA